MAKDEQEHLTLKKYLDLTEDADFLNQQWKQLAECMIAVNEHPDHYDPMDWFPTAFGHHKDYVPAKVEEVCDRCPVRLECLTLAIYTNEVSGIWGGQPIRNVKRMRRKIRTVLRNPNVRRKS